MTGCWGWRLRSLAGFGLCFGGGFEISEIVIFGKKKDFFLPLFLAEFIIFTSTY
jgi:hypothetical protein